VCGGANVVDRDGCGHTVRLHRAAERVARSTASFPTRLDLDASGNTSPPEASPRSVVRMRSTSAPGPFPFRSAV
jgi:hypothetical protein